jgi:hypothetical protein
MAMAHVWWRDRAEVALALWKKKVYFSSSLVAARIRMVGEMVGGSDVGWCVRKSGRRRGRVLGWAHAHHFALAIFCVGSGQTAAAWAYF